MTVQPIIDSLTLVRFAVVSALQAQTQAGVFWDLAPESAELPLIVVQSQDAGGQGAPHLSAIGWTGAITVKALASLLQPAEALLADVAPAMDDVTAPTGYAIISRYLRPIYVPASDGVYQAGHTWQITLERA